MSLPNANPRSALMEFEARETSDFEISLLWDRLSTRVWVLFVARALKQRLPFLARKGNLAHDCRSVPGRAFEGKAPPERFDAVAHADEPRRVRGLGAAD